MIKQVSIQAPISDIIKYFETSCEYSLLLLAVYYCREKFDYRCLT